MKMPYLADSIAYHTVADILLITPPFTQLNTPYPATAYLKGFLNTKGISSYQCDLGIEVILDIFSSRGLRQIFAVAPPTSISANAARIKALHQLYINTIDDVMRLLQGVDQTLARKVCSLEYLPQAGRFEQIDDLEWAFGNMGMQDKAKYIATLYIEDIADYIKECVDPEFGFSRYAERLGMSANSFDELHDQLQSELSYIDTVTLPLLAAKIQLTQPKLVCLSVPFPGNLYSALRCGQYIKQHYPSTKVAMGGGYPNTELRSLTDVRVFDYIDYITLDDGELPIELLHSNVTQAAATNPDHNFYKRTYLRQDGEVLYNNFSLRKDYPQLQVGTPDYSDLLLDKYISVIEIANPMHSLWSDGRWNKLTMAHGCYWGKCTFCDISLSYIKDYEPLTARTLVDRMQQIIAQTGERGFHFVDEAAPPSLMRALAVEIIRRKVNVSWWTNIRFEKSFTADLCRLLQESGCIAVSGGLEVASDRLLTLIQKGVTVEQVANVTRSFIASGIMVHAYLMYGYPTQTQQETIDSLEMVRQLFEAGVLQSGFWHQFAMTTHSPVGMDPEAYGVIPHKEPISFADNDVAYTDSTGIDHGQFSDGLKKSLFNYMHGIGFDYELQEWFDMEIPATTIDPDYIQKCLQHEHTTAPKPSAKLLWLGGEAVRVATPHDDVSLTWHSKTATLELLLPTELADWLQSTLPDLSPESAQQLTTYSDIQQRWQTQYEDFDALWQSDEMEELRQFGLLVL